jgi:hypothetical protein
VKNRDDADLAHPIILKPASADIRGTGPGGSRRRDAGWLRARAITVIASRSAIA